MDLNKASVHDVQYLKEIANSKMKNAALAEDKGYKRANTNMTCFTNAMSNYKYLAETINTNKQSGSRYSENQEKELKLYFLNYAIR